MLNQDLNLDFEFEIKNKNYDNVKQTDKNKQPSRFLNNNKKQILPNRVILILTIYLVY